MSFANTRTPRKPEGIAKWQVPQRRSRTGPMEFYLEGEIRARFCKLFPKHSNVRIMKWFGISFATLQRFKRELGLHKDMKAIRKEQAKDVKKICEKNGYYDSLRGKRPSPQCMEAYKRKVAEGFHPLKALKAKNPRKYKKVLERRKEKRIALERKEEWRINLGLKQETKLHRPLTPFTRQQCCIRHNMMKQGYIMGDMRERFGERYVIFYNKETNRSVIRERHAVDMGFSIRRLLA